MSNNIINTMRTLPITVIIFSCLFVVQSQMCAQGSASKKSDIKKGRRAKLNEGAKETRRLTLPEVIHLLEGVREGILPSGRPAQRVQERGVDFLATDEVLDQLKRAGAAQELIDLIPRPPVPVCPPAPPPAKFGGPLNITCSPAECQISWGAGETSGGAFSLSSLPPGDFLVSARKEGYDPQVQRITLAEGKIEEIKFDLKPAVALLEKAGADLILRVLGAMGGPLAMAEAGSVDVDGTASFGEQSSVNWSIAGRLRLPESAEIDTRSPGQCRVIVDDRSVKPECKGKLKASSSGQELWQAAMLLRDFHLSALLDRIVKSNARLSAEPGTSPDTSELRAEFDKSVYTITVGRDLLPSSVVFVPTEGNQKGLKVTYSDYTTVGRARFPRKIAFSSLSSQQPRGVFQFKSTKPAGRR